MIAPALATLPAALAARLDDAQRQALLEAPREKRLAVLAAALALPEAEALAALAAAAGLDTASNLEPDPAARGLLPPSSPSVSAIPPRRDRRWPRSTSPPPGCPTRS